jgi:hypothetical protein
MSELLSRGKLCFLDAFALVLVALRLIGSIATTSIGIYLIWQRLWLDQSCGADGEYNRYDLELIILEFMARQHLIAPTAPICS